MNNLAYVFLLSIASAFSVASAATIQLDKETYCRGDDIHIQFQDVEGVGVWIGLIRSDGIEAGTDPLPTFHLSALMQWILTCGRRDNCDVWPTDGTVALTTEHVVVSDYLVAISGDRAGFKAQAMSTTISVVDCTPSSSPSFQQAITEVPSKIPVEQPSTQPTAIASSMPTSAASPQPSFASSSPSTSPSPPPTEMVIAPEATKQIMALARADIAELILDDEDLIGKFLRLSFHDCVGGCNGCVDMTNPDNAGLEKPIKALKPIVDKHAGGILTRTDIWMLSALVAIEEALPFSQRDMEFSTQWVGRKTCESLGDCGVGFDGSATECSAMRGPHIELPHSTVGTKTIQEFFEDEFDFDPQQTTAIMGAHSVGRMFQENLGFVGIWDVSLAELDVGYWTELVADPPNFEIRQVNNNHLPDIPNRLQWQAELDDTDITVTMMNSDIALVRNIGDIDTVDCTFQDGDNACSKETPFFPHARRYSSSTSAFLSDFHEVMLLMINHKHEKPLDECPESKICSFGFHSPNFSLPAPIAPPSPFPTFVPAVLPASAEDAILLVDRQCYDRGDTLTATFQHVVGEGVWIGYYKKQDVEDFRSLPPLQDLSLIDWILSCNSRSNCGEWLTQGTVQFENLLEDPGDYVLVISGEGGAREGQASVDFKVGCLV
ncbi:MAG: hypothetical protein SGILL_003781 [Bacillariaceae sp.]